MFGKRISFGGVKEGSTGISDSLRNGKSVLPAGTCHHIINFGTEFPNDGYTLTTSLINNLDNPVSIYSYTLTDTTTSGFHVEFSGKLDTDNFVLHWIAIL